jgi:hypothetical protein
VTPESTDVAPRLGKYMLYLRGTLYKLPQHM